MTPLPASERLRELGPPFDLTEVHSWVEVDGVMREMNSMVKLYDALPLIADVVEAAEAGEPLVGFAKGAKLHAALTDLREALGGDVT